jgi:hypothetical protein
MHILHPRDPAPPAHRAPDFALLTAACEAGRCARCRGQVISLAYLGPCHCGCHAEAAEPAEAVAS